MHELTWLNQSLPPHFPPAEQALEEPNGLLAVGGQLSSPWLVHAYQQGIFPWFSEDEPILWWSPSPRCVFNATPPILNRRMRRWLRQHSHIKLTLDEDFDLIIEACANISRDGQSGTWISSDMKKAYRELFDLGWASAIGVWHNNDLMGGLYGVTIGQMYYGESMFSNQSGGSKLALAAAQWLMNQGVWQMIDAQVVSPHLLRLGAQQMPREQFLNRMAKAAAAPRLNRNELFSSEACLKDLRDETL